MHYACINIGFLKGLCHNKPYSKGEMPKNIFLEVLMMKKIKNGWMRIAGYDLLVRDGYVVCGIKHAVRGIGTILCHPYEPCKQGGWIGAQPLAKTFSTRLKKGTIKMA